MHLFEHERPSLHPRRVRDVHGHRLGLQSPRAGPGEPNVDGHGRARRDGRGHDVLRPPQRQFHRNGPRGSLPRYPPVALWRRYLRDRVAIGESHVQRPGDIRGDAPSRGRPRGSGHGIRQRDPLLTGRDPGRGGDRNVRIGARAAHGDLPGKCFGGARVPTPSRRSSEMAQRGTAPRRAIPTVGRATSSPSSQ